MLTANEFYAQQARADSGLLLLFLTVGAALLCGWMLRHVIPVSGARFAMPLPVVALPRWSARVSLLGWVVIAGLALRMPALWRPLWYDELFTARLMTLPLQNLPGAIMGDVHPPLFYLLNWFITRIVGTSEPGLRLLPLVFGVGWILISYHLARVLKFSERAALLAAGMIALLPAMMNYSTEARGYSMLAYLALYALAALAARRATAFIVVGSMLPLTHNLGAVYLCLFCAYGLWRHGRSWLKPTLIPALVTLAWFPFMTQQSADVADGFWLNPLTPGGFLAPIVTMTAGSKLSETLVLWVYIPLIALTVWGLFSALRNDIKAELWVLVAAAPVTVAVVSLLWHNVYLNRALLPAASGMVQVWAYALDRQPRWLLVIVPVLVMAVGGYYATVYARTDGRTLFQSGCQNTHQVYSTGIPSAMFASYYLPDMPLTLWTDAGDMNQSLSAEARQAFQFRSGALERLSGSVCLVSFITPLTRQVEREFVAEALEAYGVGGQSHTINPTWQINLHRLELR